MWTRIVGMVAALALVGCSSVQVSDYQGRKPEFDPETFFNGTLVADGVVLSRGGKVTRYFTATIEAHWDEQSGVLDEVFQWNDGERQTRVWRFERVGHRQFRGTAGDVVGTADMRYDGNAVNMEYILDVPLSNGRTLEVRMDDWLYQTSDNTLINVTTMTKFGFRVGEVVLTMRRL